MWRWLDQAAQVLLTGTSRWCALKSCGMIVARRRGMMKAIIAVARQLAIILHRMWTDGAATLSARHRKSLTPADSY